MESLLLRELINHSLECTSHLSASYVHLDHTAITKVLAQFKVHVVLVIGAGKGLLLQLPQANQQITTEHAQSTTIVRQELVMVSQLYKDIMILAQVNPHKVNWQFKLLVYMQTLL
jgi:hypothetical protein